jgi:predicted nucleotidyltransferase
MKVGNIDISTEAITDFCQKWQIRELSLFGSVLREDFRSDSDIDVLVSFAPGAMWGFEVVDMQDELEGMFHRKVDFVMREGLRNPFRRQAILTTRRVVYAA